MASRAWVGSRTHHTHSHAPTHTKRERDTHTRAQQHKVAPSSLPPYAQAKKRAQFATHCTESPRDIISMPSPGASNTPAVVPRLQRSVSSHAASRRVHSADLRSQGSGRDAPCPVRSAPRLARPATVTSASGMLPRRAVPPPPKGHGCGGHAGGGGGSAAEGRGLDNGSSREIIQSFVQGQQAVYKGQLEAMDKQARPTYPPTYRSYRSCLPCRPLSALTPPHRHQHLPHLLASPASPKHFPLPLSSPSLRPWAPPFTPPPCVPSGGPPLLPPPMGRQHAHRLPAPGWWQAGPVAPPGTCSPPGACPRSSPGPGPQAGMGGRAHRCKRHCAALLSQVPSRRRPLEDSSTRLVSSSLPL